MRFLAIRIVGLAFVCAIAGPFAPGAEGQIPPDEDWHQLETQHFVVVYPSSLSDIAPRAGEEAETAWRLLEERFTEGPGGRVYLVLTDHVDAANGYASPIPYNQIVVFVQPPMDGGNLAYYDDWLQLVITHELVHTFHIDMKGTLGTLARGLFGRVPSAWPVFPSHSAPTWVVEGLATFYESQLTGAGRAAGTWHEMVLRTAVLEGALAGPTTVAGVSSVWPDGNRPYVYGSMFLRWLAERHGEERVAALADAIAGQWIPFRLDAAMHDAIGLSLEEEWGAWESELLQGAEEAVRRLEAWGPLTRGEPIDQGGRLAERPVISPDGATLAYARSDGVEQTQIRVAKPDGSDPRSLVRLNGVSSVSWAPDGALIYAQQDYVDLHRRWSDLYRVTLDGEVRRISQGARLTHPDVSPDGSQVVAVRNGGGSTVLVVLDLSSGEERVLTEPRDGEHWAYPRWSPDGDHLAAIRWRTGAYMDVVVLDRDGSTIQEVTRDRAVDTTPAWSPDGRWLLWASDRTGVSNLMAAPVNGAVLGSPVQLTNLTGGALHPAVDPAGDWLYFSSYHADGWHIERVPFTPRVARAPQATDERFRSGGRGIQARSASTTGSGGRSYSPWRTLVPRYWLPVYTPAQKSRDFDGRSRTAVETGLGLSTGSVDAVGRHGYGLTAVMSLDGRFSGGVAYTYRGLGNPILGVSARQIHDPESRTVGVTFPDSTVGEYFLQSRERGVAVSATVFRRRVRNVAGLTFSGGLLRENLFLEDLTGEPGPTLSRPKPETTFLEGRTSLSFSNTQFPPFAISPEDGVAGFVSFGVRHATGLSAEERGVVGDDRGYQEVLGELALFKSLPGPGFSHHVLGLRVSAGRGFGPGADRGHFDVGGAEGALGVFGESQLFPIRGYDADRRFGNRAWTASAEYRFPIGIVDRTVSSLPFFIDRLSGTVFFDAGNAWGPESRDSEGRVVGARGGTLMSGGGELQMRFQIGYLGSLDGRVGVGIPLEAGDGARVYVRLGRSF